MIFVNVAIGFPPSHAIRPFDGLSFRLTIHKSNASSATHSQFFLQFQRNSLRFIPGKETRVASEKSPRRDENARGGALESPARRKKRLTEGRNRTKEGRKDGSAAHLPARLPARLPACPAPLCSPDRVR